MLVGLCLSSAQIRDLGRHGMHSATATPHRRCWLLLGASVERSTVHSFGSIWIVLQAKLVYEVSPGVHQARAEQVGAEAAFCCGEAKTKDVERHHKGRNSICDRLCFTPLSSLFLSSSLSPSLSSTIFTLQLMDISRVDRQKWLERGLKRGAWRIGRRLALSVFSFSFPTSPLDFFGVLESSMTLGSTAIQKQSWSKDVVLETGPGFTPSGSQLSGRSLLTEVPQPIPLPAHGLCSRNDSDCLLKAHAQGKALCILYFPTFLFIE
ncbi:hypothetical protein DFH08DRAFT_465293 [Mycena albidolilacea]|uniref:Uncharacterized protein n=1 Tax=Mycena albidolilacea TaxID=1033008 RepID=A0AAD7AFX1_9AGAR|nr:hypothetical protein DFH08DRAFT_465293 [Mycena albidolilacea]